MKRILLIGMIAMAVLSCACGQEVGSGTVETGKAEETEKYEIIETEQVTEMVIEVEEDALLPNVYEVPGYSIYVDVPDMHPIESGFTQVYYEDQVKYVTFSCIQVESAQDENEAFEKTFKPFVNSMSGLDIINQLGEVEDENITINGINVYSFEGLLNCGSNPVYDAYIKGYSFVYDGMPCAIIGVVMDETQPQEQIDAVKEIVDAMILTVRSEQ